MFWLIEKLMGWLVDRERRALEDLKRRGRRRDKV